MASLAEAVDNDAGFETTQLTPAIGAELSGISLSEELDDSVVANIRQALLDHKVIFFRDQHLTQEQLLRFASRFGDLEIHPATPKDHPIRRSCGLNTAPKQGSGKYVAQRCDMACRALTRIGFKCD